MCIVCWPSRPTPAIRALTSSYQAATEGHAGHAPAVAQLYDWALGLDPWRLLGPGPQGAPCPPGTSEAVVHRAGAWPQATGRRVNPGSSSTMQEREQGAATRHASAPLPGKGGEQRAYLTGWLGRSVRAAPVRHAAQWPAQKSLNQQTAARVLPTPGLGPAAGTSTGLPVLAKGGCTCGSS